MNFKLFVPSKYLTIRQFAEKKGITTQGVRKQISTGKIPKKSVVLCGLTYILKTELKRK